RRRAQPAAAKPDPTPVTTGRATVIDVGAPLGDADQGRAWLEAAGEPEIEDGLAVLNRALHSFRLVTADPYLYPVSRRQTLVARLGYGAGEQVADGLWSAARELIATERRQRRTRALAPQSRLAAVLGARGTTLACEELVLRARLDLDQGRDREAALQLLVALDATLAELRTDPAAPALTERVDQLRDQRQGVTAAAQAALEGALGPEQRETVAFTVGRIEAALRARDAQNS
ncbi:MAG: hypothetical protein ABI323_00720, partial [Solirubrobacteraceae bacterium]